jgi:Aldehyde dehydrogenase family
VTDFQKLEEESNLGFGQALLQHEPSLQNNSFCRTKVFTIPIPTLQFAISIYTTSFHHAAQRAKAQWPVAVEDRRRIRQWGVGGGEVWEDLWSARYGLIFVLPENHGLTLCAIDPTSGKLVGTAPEFDAADTQKAIDAAAAAFPSFRTKTGRERSKLLRKWYDLMVWYNGWNIGSILTGKQVENAEDIARLITWENGKPLADAKGEAAYAASFFEWFSEEAPRIYGDTIPASVAGNRVVTIKEPVGVCGLITPLVKCPFVLKPSDNFQMELPRCHDHSKDRSSSRGGLHSGG